MSDSEVLYAMRLLSAADDETRPERAARWLQLNRAGEPQDGRMLAGGPSAAIAWDEAGAAYVAGLYLGGVLLAQTFLEHELAGQLDFYGGPGSTTPRLGF